MKTKVVIGCVLLGAALLGSGNALAQTCPDPPDDTLTRRSLAKEWFTRAEASEASGDRESAVKQYACSLRLVPHPATAYNLGTAAERSGDLSLAVDAFRAYLKLLPDAPDRSHIEARITRLDADLAELRKQIYIEKPAPNESATKTPSRSTPGSTDSKPPMVETPAREPNRTTNYDTAGWVMLGGGVAAIGTGVVFNIVARRKMDTCRNLQVSAPTTAKEACDSARPFAYGSYVLLGLGAALGATGAALMLWDHGDGTDLSLAPSLLPGGGSFVMSGRF